MSRSFIPYGKQSISEEDIEAVSEVLRSDFLTQGPIVPEFEQSIAAKSGSIYGVAANSATSSLHVACLALGVTKGDYVWTSPNTFIASANCAVYCGAVVDFVDIDPRTYNLCSNKLEDKLVSAKQQGTLPKVVIPVHFGGHPCDMEAIWKLSKIYGFKIIEDASHAVGAKYNNRPIGSQYSDICIFSFHPVKVMTSAEGGMAITNDQSLADKMRTLVNQGITRYSDDFINKAPGSWYYEQQELGFNYRMTELQAALGLSQLARLDSFIEKRRKLVNQYQELLADFPIQLPFEADYAYSSWHLFPILLNDALKTHRVTVFEDLRSQGIGTQVHYIPVHTQPFYKQQNGVVNYQNLSVAENYYSRTLSLPLYPDLTDEDLEQVKCSLSKALERVNAL